MKTRVVSQGEVWWADLPVPSGSEPGFKRPVVVLQSDPFNRCGLKTVVCAPCLSRLRLAKAPGNVLVEPDESGLPEPSVVNVTQVMTVDLQWLWRRAGTLPDWLLRRVLDGVSIVLGM